MRGNVFLTKKVRGIGQSTIVPFIGGGVFRDLVIKKLGATLQPLVCL